MKSILSIILLTALVFSLSTCKPAAPSDIFSAAYAKEKNKNTAAMAQAKTFAAKALALHKKKNFIQAEIEWKNALKLYADGEIYYRFGDTLFNLSRFEDAVKSYKNAIELNHPEKKYVYYNMACAYSRMKDVKGREYLALAIQNGYNSYEHIKRDKDLAYLRSKINLNPDYYNLQNFIDENDIVNRELFKAIDEENIDKVKDLIKKGANVNFVNFVTINFESLNWRFSPLMLASKKGNIKIVELLLDNGANINYSFLSSTVLETSVLCAAAINDRVDVVKLLIKRGINMKKIGGSVLAYMVPEYVKKFEVKKMQIINLLINSGASINTSAGSYAGTPLITAIKSCNINLINYFLRKGADPNAMWDPCCASSTLSPLMAAAEYKCNEAISILLAKNVDINLANNYGETAIFFALYQRNIEAVNLLLKKGADVKKFIKRAPLFIQLFDKTILMIAIENCPEMVKTLIQKGADIHYKSKDYAGKFHHTALSIAKSKGLNDIVKLLIQAGARE